jgi:hypothetical protein
MRHTHKYLPYNSGISSHSKELVSFSLGAEFVFKLLFVIV